MITAAFLLLAGVGQVHADMIFNNLVYGWKYSHGQSMGIGTFSGVYRDAAFQFTINASQAYALDQIEAAVSVGTGTTDKILMHLMSDTGGTPSAIIEDITVEGQTTPLSFYNGSYWLPLYPLMAGTSSLHPVLQPGTNYWLAVQAPEPDTQAGWYGAQADGIIDWRTGAWRVGTPTWTVGPNIGSAFRIGGTPITSPVPVPGAALLGAVGLSVAGWRLRRKTD